MLPLHARLHAKVDWSLFRLDCSLFQLRLDCSLSQLSLSPDTRLYKVKQGLESSVHSTDYAKSDCIRFLFRPMHLEPLTI